MNASTAKILLLAAFIVVLPGVATAASDTDTQTMDLDVDDIAVIGVSAATVPTMTITTPTAGNEGDDPLGDSDSSTTVEYTSVVTSGQTRTITAEITTGDVPAGTQLTLIAESVPASCGSAAAEQILSTTEAKAIITGIGSCATGGSGPTLTYSFEVTSVTSLDADGDTAPVVTLTITESI